jgi:hypothetical protein
MLGKNQKAKTSSASDKSVIAEFLPKDSRTFKEFPNMWFFGLADAKKFSSLEQLLHLFISTLKFS